MLAVGDLTEEGVDGRSGCERNECLVERVSLLGHPVAWPVSGSTEGRG